MRLLAFIYATALFSSAIAAPVEVTSHDLRGAIQPQVAVSDTGAIHIVFGRKDNGAIFHTSSVDRGRTYSKPVQIGTLPKLALGMRRGPRVAVTGQTVVISAISHEDGNIHVWNSENAGRTWKEASPINDVPKSAREGLHDMVSDGKGAFFATWLDLRNKGTELWGATSRDGARTWTNSLVYRSPDGHICECCQPTAAMDANGRVAVMWRNWIGGSRDMYAATSNDAGKTFSTAEKLGSGTWKLNACPMDGGAIALAADGHILTAWRREKTVYSAEMGTGEQLLADSAMQPIVTTARGVAYYFWQSGDKLMLKKGSSDPRPLAEKAAFATAAPFLGRGPIVVWESTAGGNGIWAELLD